MIFMNPQMSFTEIIFERIENFAQIIKNQQNKYSFFSKCHRQISSLILNEFDSCRSVLYRLGYFEFEKKIFKCFFYSIFYGVVWAENTHTAIKFTENIL